jgi:uncharacterized membrane protein
MDVISTEKTGATEHDVHIEPASRIVRVLIGLAVVGFVLSLFVVLAYVWNFWGKQLSPNQEIWGQFGDYLGGMLNPMFSGLALIGLLATLGMQVRQMKISASESKASAAAFALQIGHLQKQTFEGTFFQTLKLHNDIVSALEMPGDHSETLKGRACFSEILRHFKQDSGLERGDMVDDDQFDQAYFDFFDKFEDVLGHYFRLLYNLVKFVNNAAIDDKRFYTNLIRAQLSSAELELLFYNCLSDYGRAKFKPLVESFSLFKTFPETAQPPSFLMMQYSREAFGGAYPASWEDANQDVGA